MQSRVPAYVLITPARNEADYIELTIRSMIVQTALPLKWIIVSDGSTDRTDEIVGKYTTDYPWIELVRMPERRERDFAGKVYSFNAGYRRVKDLPYQVIGNLDADVSFEPDYFHFLLSKIADDLRIGVAGTPFKEGSQQQYDYRFTSSDHVSGQIQIFRRQCFEEIGGYVPIKTGGIDLVAVISARMKGWLTRTYQDKTYLHHRTMSSAKRGPLAIAFDGGRTDYTHGCDPIWEVFRSLYQMTKPPLLLRGALCFAGYFGALITRAERVVPADLIRFRKVEQRRRLRDFAVNMMPWMKQTER
jgi:glycosyltransferase involved in cell wall biosynthesis